MFSWTRSPEGAGAAGSAGVNRADSQGQARITAITVTTSRATTPTATATTEGRRARPPGRGGRPYSGALSVARGAPPGGGGWPYGEVSFVAGGPRRPGGGGSAPYGDGSSVAGGAVTAMRRPLSTTMSAVARPSTPRITPVAVAMAAPTPSRAIWKTTVYCSSAIVIVESSGPPRVSAWLRVNVCRPAATAASTTTPATAAMAPVTVPPRSAGRNAGTARAHTRPNVAAATTSLKVPGAVAGSVNARTIVARPSAAGSSPRSQDTATAAGEKVTRDSASRIRPARRGQAPARSSASASSGPTTRATSSGMIVSDRLKPSAGHNEPVAPRIVS